MNFLCYGLDIPVFHNYDDTGSILGNDTKLHVRWNTRLQYIEWIYEKWYMRAAVTELSDLCQKIVRAPIQYKDVILPV